MSNNTYDSRDIVRREAVIIADGAGSLKVAAYRVRDPETGNFSDLQFHATFNNMVLAVMGEQSAKLFASFVNQTLGFEPTSAFKVMADHFDLPKKPESDPQ